MNFIARLSLSTLAKMEILELWNNEYPEQLAYKSKEEFDEFIDNLNGQSHILIVDSNHSIKGWYVDFNRNNEKWFVIILDSNIQRKGFGEKMIELAKAKESHLNGWVIDHNRDRKRNGETYKSPLKFYLKNGFKKVSKTRLELHNISAVKIKWNSREYSSF